MERYPFKKAVVYHPDKWKKVCVEVYTKLNTILCQLIVSNDLERQRGTNSGWIGCPALSIQSISASLRTYASMVEKLPKKLSYEFQQLIYSTPHHYRPVSQLWGLCSRQDRATTHHGSPCGFICMNSERTQGKATSTLEGQVMWVARVPSI